MADLLNKFGTKQSAISWVHENTDNTVFRHGYGPDAPVVRIDPNHGQVLFLFEDDNHDFLWRPMMEVGR